MRVHLQDMTEAVIEYDPGAHVWHVALGDHALTLREWLWGERKRLLHAALTERRIDPTALAEGYCNLLYSPPPPKPLAMLFAYVGLRLFGTETRAQPRPLATAEQALADRFGCLPGALSAERVSDLDVWLDGLAPLGGAPEPGWSRLDFADLSTESAS